jgi:hypothetical protein
MTRDMLTIREAADVLAVDVDRLLKIAGLLKIPYWQGCVPRERVDEARRAGNEEARFSAIRAILVQGYRSIGKS